MSTTPDTFTVDIIIMENTHKAGPLSFTEAIVLLNDVTLPFINYLDEKITKDLPPEDVADQTACFRALWSPSHPEQATQFLKDHPDEAARVLCAALWLTTGKILVQDSIPQVTGQEQDED